MADKASSAEGLAFDRRVAGTLAQVRAVEGLQACFSQAAPTCWTQALPRENPEVTGGWVGCTELQAESSAPGCVEVRGFSYQNGGREIGCQSATVKKGE